MPRQARIDAPCALHHIIARGIERSKIFLEDADYADFLRRLGHLMLQTETKCFAWALIPNHLHLLFKSGNVPIATIMRRLLTGYATGFNRRHQRSGHLFQNRYKSILCQEDIYLKELVRYIHLNPLRARLVGDVNALSDYPYAGHGAIMGRQINEWQTTDTILALFGNKLSQARYNYFEYVAAGAELGRQPSLTGGGLIRSAGGWAGVQLLRKAGGFQKSDERILGDGDFVESVLAEAGEKMTRRFGLNGKGLNLDQLQQTVVALVGINPEELVGASKARKVVKARILFCYWAVRELGLPMTEIAQRLKIALPTVSVAVQKGEQIVRGEGLDIGNMLNVNI
ncbi:MAG: transposase [Deltaproteobacteria bacterium]|nr:transposase [Deltaproteobacteria bacterium]